MYTPVLIFLLVKCLFVSAINFQFFVGPPSQTSNLEQILADLKQNKQQLQNFEQANRQRLQDLEQANRQRLQVLEQSNRQELQILEQANRQRLQNLEKTNTEQLKNLREQNEQQLKNLEKQISDLGSTPPKPENYSHIEEQIPKNCKELFEDGNNLTDFYTVRPESSPESFRVFCDMDTDGGGWTYLLNRSSGNQDFDQNWDDYKRGFGNLSGDFWLGLENLYHLTGFENNELLIKMVDTDYNETTARYSFFSVGSEAQGYCLKVIRRHSGDAGDNLSHLLGVKFSTKDRDQDLNTDGNCASDLHGGWWYGNDCSVTRLTGYFFLRGIYWEFGKPLAEVKMMVRPRTTINKK